MKVASPVREGVVGNVPKGNALATYFTAAVMLHGQKSKLGEVFCAGLMVECLACTERAEDLCAQD